MSARACLFRIRCWLGLFIAGLVLSGITAFPLPTELQWILAAMDRSGVLTHSAFYDWLSIVYHALRNSDEQYPFLAYGTDWLAFAHLVIAAAFIGPWRDPVRNRWVVTFGLIACAAVLPLALIAGSFRGIPLGWRLIDCSFGIAGAAPLWICRRYIAKLERLI